MDIRPFVSKYFAKKVIYQQKKYYDNPERTQKKVFLSLIAKAKNTKFGREHSFHKIKNYKDYQSLVPIRNYEGLKKYIDAMLRGEKDILWKSKPLYIAKTSGTTSGAKYIPITQDSIANQIQGARDALLYYIFEKKTPPNFVSKKMIFLSGSPELEKINNIHMGRLSGIVHHHIPSYLQKNQLPSYSTNCIDEWEEKLDKIIEETITQPMSVISGITPWVQMYFDKLYQKTNKKIKDIFPDFDLLIHGGVNFKPYKKTLFDSIGTKIDTIETFPASEGFIAFQDSQYEKGMRLILNGGIFYEFIEPKDIQKENPKRYTIEDIELEKNYAIILTTNAGLWAYSIGDTVKFISKNPYRLVVTGRIKHFLSAFGEHVIAEEVEKAIYNTLDIFKEVKIKEFSVAPYFKKEGGKPHHEWNIAFQTPPENIEKFTERLDEEMTKQNIYYKDLIDGNVLDKLKVNILPYNAFEIYMKSIQKLGGQNKVPRLANDRKIADALWDLFKR